MPDNKSAKGNPAHTRMANAARKTRRSLSWQRGQKRNALHREEQKARETLNRQLAERGIPVPFGKRAAKRHPDLVSVVAALRG